MSIITEVERIQQAKQDLKNKLLEKGVDVGDKKIDEYALMLDDIQSGGENTLKKLLDFTKSTSNMFRENTTITDLTGYISSETENVTDMSYMFFKCSSLITVPPLNTSKVTNMESMFFNCTSLTTVPPLNTSNLKYLSNVFSGCTSLTTVPPLNTSKVTSTQSMFRGCTSLTIVPPLNTSKVTNMESMFFNCTSLTTFDISYYNISKTFNIDYWCRNCYSLKAIIIRSFSSLGLSTIAFTNCYHLLGTVDATYNPNGDKDGYIYVPRSMVDKLKSATNWSTYADQIRALEDYTVDGTTTGELDESKVNA